MTHHTKFALTNVALAYLMGRDENIDLGGNATGFYMECQGECDPERLSIAINKVILRQPMLRTIIFQDGTQAELADVPEYVLPVTDLSGLTNDELEAYFQTLRDEQSHTSFPLQAWPMFSFALYKLSEEKSRVVVRFDMMLVDRYSIEILIHEMNAYYHNPGACLPPLAHSYQDYVHLLEAERSRNLARDKAYWSHKIAGMPPAPPIPFEKGKHSGGRFTGRVKMYNREFYQMLQDKLYEQRILPSIYMLYCYGKCLSRFSSAKDLSVSITTAHRTPNGQVFSDLIGDFTKLILVDLHMEHGIHWVEQCKEIQKRVREYIQKSSFDGLDVMKEIARAEGISGKAAFPFAFTSRLTSQDESYWNFLGNIQYQISRTPQLAVDCQVSEHNEQLEVRWDCLEGVLSEEFLDAMFAHYNDLIVQTVDGLDASAGINEEWVARYNNTATPIPNTTLQNLVKAQALKTPENPALTVDGKTYSYRELNDASDRVAGVLHQKYGSGQVVMVDGQRRAETIITILGILKSGNVYVPVDGTYPQARIDSIRQSCNAVAVLTPEDCNRWLTENPPLFVPLPGAPEDVAYIIFTSGSTGIPKGVVITQDAVCNTILDINQRFNVTEQDSILGISSFWFDLSVYDIFGAFSTGAHLVLSEKMDMESIAELMNEYRISFWNTVPAIMDLLVSSGRSLPKEYLRNVLLSGDWIPLELPKRVKRMFPNANIYSLGGATEGSIWSIYYPIEQVDEDWSSIPYGYPLGNQTIHILDEAGRLCPIGVQGEICIGGRGVAKEYCGNEPETQAHYIEHPVYGRIYRTGDYGRMSPKGYVLFLGRMDQQVKLHGFRIELGEIESVLLKDDSINKALATVIKNNGSSSLVAYVVCNHNDSFNEKKLSAHVAESLPAYMNPSMYVCLEELPLTANGKIDRKALPVPNVSEIEGEPPRTDQEKAVSEMWKTLLGVERVARQDNFFYLGGDSLSGLRLSSQIRQSLGIKIELSEIFDKPVLKDLCACLEAKNLCERVEGDDLPALEVEPDKNHIPFPLTDVQRSYWIGAKGLMNLSGVTTHVLCEITCVNVDIDRLEQAFNTIINEQGMLRAVVLQDGWQQIIEKVPYYSIGRTTVIEGNAEATLQAMRLMLEKEQFDSSTWPLFRVEAVQYGETVSLFVDLDNLIFDGYSVQLLFKRWNELYQNQSVPANSLQLSFRDYVLALEKVKHTKRYVEDKQYWREQVKSMPPAPELVTVNSPDELYSQTIAHYHCRLQASSWKEIKDIGKDFGLTPSSVLLAAYAQMLSLWSRKPAFTINLTQFNRLFEHPEINQLIGDFTLLSMLPVDTAQYTTLQEQANQIQRTLSYHLAHPYYGGVEVQQDYAREHQSGGVNFPVVFTSTVGMTASDLRGEMFGRVERITTETPQVWLDCQVTELEGGLNISLEAVKELFAEEMPQDMLVFFTQLLMLMAEDSELWKRDINEVIYENELIPTLKHREVLSETPSACSGETLESLFVTQALKSPERVAVIDRSRTLSYGQLYYEAVHLSRTIELTNEKIVAVLLNKGWSQVVATLAALMAGAAYLPLDPSHPIQRTQDILATAEVRLVLTEPELSEAASGLHVSVLMVEEQSPYEVLPEHKLRCRVEDLAYIIFTSGSTGIPKGVMIPHQGAVNTILDINARFDIGADDRVLALSALNFDLSVYDIFGMLCCGGALVIPDELSRRDPVELSALVQKYQVTVWNSVPALMQLMVDYAENKQERIQSLRVVMLSGDWIGLELAERILLLHEHIQLYSLGGATEASIWSNYYPVQEVSASWRSVPYGYPLSGQSFRILNEQMQDCPPFVTGKLYIGGAGIALGYLNDEERTQERFIDYSRTGERLYDTGDLGMYWPDGTIEFLGREDYQIKIRGHRIELGEIEAAMKNSCYIKDAVAAAVQIRGRSHLVASVVAASGEMYDPQFISAEALEEARKRLPEYMVPSLVYVVEELPLTANGKIDRKSLMEQGAYLLAAREMQAEPEEMSNLERLVASVWQQILGLEALPGRNEDFFDLGGDSLDYVKVRTELSEKHGLEISMVDLFAESTIAAMAEAISVNAEVMQS